MQKGGDRQKRHSLAQLVSTGALAASPELEPQNIPFKERATTQPISLDSDFTKFLAVAESPSLY